MNEYITITLDNIEKEHLCCAIADKKHQIGVNNKRNWIKDRISEGHIFRKLNAQGKVFIEYAPLEKAWCSVEGEDYIYIYCLWVAGSFKGKGYAKDLLNSCIEDAKQQNKKGICIITSKKKKPFLSEKGFFEKYGFKVVDSIDDYELLALQFDETKPHFTTASKTMTIENKNFTIYYSSQCPYTNNCIEEITQYTKDNKVDIDIIHIDSASMAKKVPCIFNNWANFYNGKFISNTLLNKNSLTKLLETNNK